MHMHRSSMSQIRRYIMFCERINRPNNPANMRYYQYLSRTLSTSWRISEIFSEYTFFLSSEQHICNNKYLYSLFVMGRSIQRPFKSNLIFLVGRNTPFSSDFTLQSKFPQAISFFYSNAFTVQWQTQQCQINSWSQWFQRSFPALKDSINLYLNYR